ncbi:IS6 family transposase [Agrobacterium vitis]|nr:IS6 family transposase [Agrobacterium vitis]MVA36796.1 DDE-type integrase/transposase/recombinase [Agrobacterium vitis]
MPGGSAIRLSWNGLTSSVHPVAFERKFCRQMASGRGGLAIKGGKYWLWRAVDADRYVLNETVQSRRDIKAANWLLIRLLKTAGRPPKRIIIKKLRSYDAAKREIEPEIGSRTTAIQ